MWLTGKKHKHATIPIIIEKYETESNYDFVVFKDGKGALIERLSGAAVNYETDYAETESVTVEFSSDSSETRFGTLIKNVKVIY